MLDNLLRTLSILLSFLLLWGCWPQEDESLLQPNLQDTAYVRILNLASDHQPRSLWIDGKLIAQAVPYAQVSPVQGIVPDTVTMRVHRSADSAATHSFSLVLQKSTYTTVVILQHGGKDTAIVFVALPIVTTPIMKKVSLRFLNAVDDSREYALNIGCPTEVPTFPFLSFREFSPFVETAEQQLPVSILERENGMETVQKFVQAHCVSPYSYLLVLYRDAKSQLQLGIFAEQKGQENWAIALPVEDLTAELSVANLTGTDISLEMRGSVLFPSIPSWFRSGVQSVTACSGIGSDTLVVRVGAQRDTLLAKFEAQKRYVVIVTDEGGDLQSFLYEFPANATNSDAITLQVYHAAGEKEFLVASGGRQSSTGQYVAGESLGEKLRRWTVTAPVQFPAAPIPLIVLSQDRSLRFLAGFLLTPAPGNTVAVLLEQDGRLALALLEENSVSSPLDTVQRARLFRLLNLSEKTFQLSLHPLFTDLAVGPGSEITTVLPFSTEQYTVNGVPYPVEQSEELRYLVPVVYIGDTLYAPIDHYALPEDPLRSAVRFLHLAPAADTISITLDSLNGEVLIDRMAPWTRGDFLFFSQQQRASFVFWNSKTREVYARLDNLSLLRGQVYTLFFYATSGKTRVYVLQEY